VIHLNFNLNDGVPKDWAREIWHQAVNRFGTGGYTVPLPEEIGKGEAFVKRYFNKPKHKHIRRMLFGRAAREGVGLKVYQKRGIFTVPFLFCAQERHLGLVKKGIVATVRVVRPNIEEAYLEDFDPRLLEGTAYALGLIHRSGLTHGDPRLRNFLNTKPYPQVFDLPAWNIFNPRLQVKDLFRFLGSVIEYSESENMFPSLLKSYQSVGLTIPVPTEWLFQRAKKSGQKNAQHSEKR
jgi:tRNA A-37 threonylcarbamoyl transferase component Bud32